jgi:RimJ/RimL family protein N-acetyltransferase
LLPRHGAGPLRTPSGSFGWPLTQRAEGRTSPEGPAPGLALRPAVLADMELIFAWRNRPEIIDLATSRRAVSWDEHAAWFPAAVVDEDRLMFLIELDGRPVGQLRFDRVSPDCCQVTIYLLPEFTGKGIGTRALALGCSRAFEQMPVGRLRAFVRDDNLPSVAAFSKVGFTTVEGDDDTPPEHRCLVLSRYREVL